MRKAILGLAAVAGMSGISSPRVDQPLPKRTPPKTPPTEHKHTREIERRKRQATRKAAKHAGN